MECPFHLGTALKEIVDTDLPRREEPVVAVKHLACVACGRHYALDGQQIGPDPLVVGPIAPVIVPGVAVGAPVVVGRRRFSQTLPGSRLPGEWPDHPVGATAPFSSTTEMLKTQSDIAQQQEPVSDAKEPIPVTLVTQAAPGTDPAVHSRAAIIAPAETPAEHAARLARESAARQKAGA